MRKPTTTKHAIRETFLAEYNCPGDPAPKVTGPYRQREIRPEFIAIHWTRNAGQAWDFQDVVVYGRYELKGGGYGKDTKSYSYSSWSMERCPDWIRQLVDKTELPA